MQIVAFVRLCAFLFRRKVECSGGIAFMSWGRCQNRWDGVPNDMGLR